MIRVRQRFTRTRSKDGRAKSKSGGHDGVSLDELDVARVVKLRIPRN